MFEGKTLTELAQEVERQKLTKKDFVADTTLLAMETAPAAEGGREHFLRLKDKGSFRVSDYCHGQIASRLAIPKPYYDRMKAEEPELLATNVNTWFQDKPETRMVRTLDDKARAFLSDRYRALDNYDLMSAALPVILKEQECELASCDVTESHLYIKALFPKVEAEIKKGDIVQAGLVISNSEIGASSLRVEPLIYRLVCTNGMITDTAYKKYHVGRGNGGINEDAIREILSDKTKQATDKAIWMQVQDVIRSAFARDIFEGNVRMLQEATKRKIIKAPDKVIEVVQKEYGLNDDIGTGIMRALIEGADLTQYGLANAVTNTANTAKNYEQATMLERTGGKIIELPQEDWEELAA